MYLPVRRRFQQVTIEKDVKISLRSKWLRCGHSTGFDAEGFNGGPGTEELGLNPKGYKRIADTLIPKFA
jgi:hypothetical protein